MTHNHLKRVGISKANRIWIYLSLTALICTMAMQGVRTGEPMTRTRSDRANSDTISIVVANDYELREYQFIPEKSSTRQTRTCSRQTDPQWRSPWNRVFNLLKAKEDARVKSAQELHGQFSKEATVAEYSPDRLYLFIGVNDQEYVPPAFINKAQVFRTESRVSLKEMIFVDDIYVSDIAWSKDQRDVIMLLEQRTIKYSLWGIFRLISGHPIPLNTYFLRVLDLNTGDIKDTCLCRDIEDGVGVITSAAFYLSSISEPK